MVEIFDANKIKENPMWATKDELEKQRMLEGAYSKIQKGFPLSQDEDETMKEYIKMNKELVASKTTNGVYKGLLESAPSKNKYAGMENLIPKKSKEASLPINPLNYSNPASRPSDEDILMYSLMKDTPKGTFDLSHAKALAEDQVTRGNYSNAFRNVRDKADATFKHMMATDLEMSHPDNAADSVKYFGVLKDFAPSLATNPVTLKSFINKSKSYGGIDEKQIIGLMQANNEHMKHVSNIQ